jgi:hypothetical protein
VGFGMIGIRMHYLVPGGQVIYVRRHAKFFTHHRCQLVYRVRFIGTDIENLIISFRYVYTFGNGIATSSM